MTGTGTFFNTPQFIQFQLGGSASDTYNGPGGAVTAYTANAGGLGFKVYEIHIINYFDGVGNPYSGGTKPIPFQGTMYFGSPNGAPFERISFGPGLWKNGKHITRFDGSDPERTEDFIVAPGSPLKVWGIYVGVDTPLIAIIGADAL